MGGGGIARRARRVIRWAEFSVTHPAFAAEIESAFTRHRHCIIGTVRPDGSPRLSGMEAWFWDGDLMLGMMPGSKKAGDLERDPRFELHSAPLDLELQQGDARVRGRVEAVEDEARVAAFAASLPHDGSGDLAIALFVAHLSGAVLIRVEGDLLVIDRWRPGEPLVRHQRT